MNDLAEMKKGLESFIEADKFIEYQHLQPAVANSTIETRDIVNKEMTICCNELISRLNSESTNDAELKQIVRKSVSRIEDAMLDTEDREFCYELYNVIGNIIGVNGEDESVDIGEKLLKNMQELLKKAGLNPDDFFPK